MKTDKTNDTLRAWRSALLHTDNGMLSVCTGVFCGTLYGGGESRMAFYRNLCGNAFIYANHCSG